MDKITLLFPPIVNKISRTIAVNAQNPNIKPSLRSQKRFSPSTNSSISLNYQSMMIPALYHDYIFILASLCYDKHRE